MGDAKAPEPLEFGKTIFDCAVHPSSDLVATGLINGKISWYELESKK